MKTITVEEAQSNFSDVLRLVRGGEEVAVTSRKKNIAQIVPVAGAANGSHAVSEMKKRKAAWAEHFKKLKTASH